MLRDHYALLSAPRTVRSMNKNFILRITSGFCVKYGPLEVSPHFPFYLQKIILSRGSQFSCISSVVSTVKQPLSWVAILLGPECLDSGEDRFKTHTSCVL